MTSSGRYGISIRQPLGLGSVGTEDSVIIFKIQHEQQVLTD